MSKFMLVCSFYDGMAALLQGGFAVRRRVTPKFWIFMIAITVMVFSVSFGVLQYRFAQGEAQLGQARGYRDDLILETRDLADELDYVQTDAYVIRAAKDELRMIMPGEVRYVNSAN